MITTNDGMSQNIYYTINEKIYEKREFLGKGTFGESYEFSNCSDGTVCAIKFIEKGTISCNWKDVNLYEATSIHKSLNHKNLVKFYEYFVNDDYFFIVTELCGKMTLLELLKIRRTLTNPEVRYFTQQLLFALQHIHQQHVIHRNLNLENVMINEKLIIKVGGFECCTNICGSKREFFPNGSVSFMAPEVVQRNECGSEVDIWSFGCIVFALLVGRIPFSDEDIEECHMYIKLGKYTIPSHINLSACKMIRHIFIYDPKCRPNATKLLKDPYYFTGYTPKKLPPSVLTATPRSKHSFDPSYKVPFPIPFVRMYLSTIRQCNQPLDSISEDQLHHLKNLLLHTLSFEVNNRPKNDDINEMCVDSSLRWMCCWVDLSHEYGLGYRLNDRKVGILFIDGTKLILFNDGTITYINDENVELSCHLCSYPHELMRKVRICSMFERTLIFPRQNTFANSEDEENDYDNVDYVTNWIRYKNKIVILFSNGMLQIKYELEGVNVILSPGNNTITFVEQNGKPRSFKLDLIKNNGCTKLLERRIWLAWKEVFKMIENKARLIVQNSL